MKLEANSKNCKVNSNLLLPEDLVIDILSRVSVKCLLNSARYVCKSWATIIGSLYFAEVHRQRTRPKPGLFVQNILSNEDSYFLDITEDLNGHSERIDLGMHSRIGSLRSTCDGILVFSDSLEQVFVVNPILKCWLRVPPLPIGESPIIDSLTLARVPQSSIFKLFMVAVRVVPDLKVPDLIVSGANWFVFYVLKVGIDDSWREITSQNIYRNYFFKQLVYSGGNDLYWIQGRRVVVMDVDKEIALREYPVSPLQMINRLFVQYFWTGNQLSGIGHTDFFGTFQIYILDTNLGKWTLYHEVALYDYVVARGLALEITLIRIRVWINDQIILQVYVHEREKVFTGYKRIHLAYNVKTRQLTNIEGIPLGHFDVWHHTNSLASFPTTV